jgi:hypothetical protein
MFARTLQPSKVTPRSRTSVSRVNPDGPHFPWFVEPESEGRRTTHPELPAPYAPPTIARDWPRRLGMAKGHQGVGGARTALRARSSNSGTSRLVPDIASERLTPCPTGGTLFRAAPPTARSPAAISRISWRALASFMDSNRRFHVGTRSSIQRQSAAIIDKRLELTPRICRMSAAGGTLNVASAVEVALQVAMAACGP